MFTPILTILGVGLAILVILALVARRMRKKIQDLSPGHFDFTIGELQAMRSAGGLSDEEYERAAATVASRANEEEGRRPVNDPRRGFDVLITNVERRQDDEGDGKAR